LLAQTHAFLPRRVPPTHPASELLIGIRRVVNHQISALDQAEHGLIGLANNVFGVRNVAERFAVVFDPVTRRTAWMIEQRSAHLDARRQMEMFTCNKVFEFELATHSLERNGKRER